MRGETNELRLGGWGVVCSLYRRVWLTVDYVCELQGGVRERSRLVERGSGEGERGLETCLARPGTKG
jgi:hypothetical protein